MARLISYTAQNRFIRGLQIGVGLLLILYIIFPIYWMASSAFQPQSALFGDYSLIPPEVTIANFDGLFNDSNFGTYLKNSIIVAIGTTTLSVFLATLAGYGLTRTSFTGKRHLARIVLFTYMFPTLLIGIPLYLIFVRLGLLNSYPALIIAQTSRALPFTLWLMWQYFQTIPIAYEESAWIFGASRPETFLKIVAPMALPGIVAISIFSFAVSWSDFTLSVIIMTEDSMLTFPVGIDQFRGQHQITWGLLNAANFIIMIPAFVLVLFFQRYIMEGFRVGG